MKVYLTGYSQRKNEIIIAVVCCIAAMLISYALFQNRLNKISEQLNTYASSEYNYIYVLNYAAPLQGIAIFPDTDVQFFLDESGDKRITVSSVMKEETSDYKSNYLKFIQDLEGNEIILSQEVADKYNLHYGDIVFAQYPYTSKMKPLKIIDFTKTEYDYMNPNIDNDIGVVFVGYDDEYERNVQCKYILFSPESQSDALATYPQIIDSIENKDGNTNFVLAQGISLIIFQVVFAIVSFVISYIVFFSKSVKLLRRCFLKGMVRRNLVLIPFVEKVMLAILPTAITLWLLSLAIKKNSLLSEIYFLLPIFIYALGTIGSCIFDCKAAKRKKG